MPSRATSADAGARAFAPRVESCVRLLLGLDAPGVLL